MSKKYYLTKQGIKKLKEEYKNLKLLRLAKTKGDVPKIWESEDVNPEYLSFQEDLEFIEHRLSELDYILKNSELIRVPPKSKRSFVNLGATVTLEEKNGSLNELTIVGTLEANPLEGKISSESPVGTALLGKRLGDEVVITSPINLVYKIKKIRYFFS